MGAPLSAGTVRGHGNTKNPPRRDLFSGHISPHRGALIGIRTVEFPLAQTGPAAPNLDHRAHSGGQLDETLSASTVTGCILPS